MERLYIIWGYIVAMDTSGIWLSGWYLIGPSIVTKALLFCTSIVTSGGPKLALRQDKRDLFHSSQIYRTKIPLILTVWFWVESQGRDPSGACVSAHSTNTSKVSLLKVPRLAAQITPVLRYFCTAPHCHPTVCAICTVPIAVQKKRTFRNQIPSHCIIISLFCSPSSIKSPLLSRVMPLFCVSATPPSSLLYYWNTPLRLAEWWESLS